MVKQKHQLFVALLCVADGVVATLACYAAWIVRRMTMEGFWPSDWQGFLKQPLAPVVVPISIAFFWLFRLYQPRRDRSIVPELGQVLKTSWLSIAGCVVILWVVDTNVVRPSDGYVRVEFLGNTFDSKRVQLAALALTLPLFLMLHRVAFRVGLRVIRRRGHNLRHVLIIGAGRLGQVVCRTLERNSWTGIHPAAFLSHHDTTARTSCLGRPVLGGLSDLDRAMDEQKPDAVYLAIPTARAAVLPAVLKRLERYPVDVRIVPDLHQRYMPHNMAVSELDGMPVLSVRESPLCGVGGLTKRALDIAGSLAGLLLFGPLMLVIAAALRLSGHAKVIFSQRRVSLGGEVFTIYKFRSMIDVEAEPQAVPAGESDSESGADGVLGTSWEVPAEWTPRNARITRLGAFLRRTSLDELPQLFNVLKGEMSLVGPRPERPELIAKFREDWRGYMLRQHVKAGMTGWAQVNGLRGRTSLRKRLQYDLFYVKHWSVWFDLRILWLTLFRGFVHRNAN